MEQYRVDGGEDGSVRADAEREGEQRDHGETRVLEERSDRVTKIQHHSAILRWMLNYSNECLGQHRGILATLIAGRTAVCAFGSP
jgi:hypothetical protein